MFAKMFVFLFLIFIPKINCDPNILDQINQFQDLLSSGNIDFMQIIQDFLSKNNLNLEDLMRFLKMFAKMTDNEFLQKLAENPFEMMSYVPKIANDWKLLQELFETPYMDGEALISLTKTAKGSTVTPIEKDLNEISLSLARIQNVYNLSIDDLLDGKFGYFQPGTTITYMECIRLAQQSLLNMDLDLAIEWYEKGLYLKANENKKQKSLDAIRALKNVARIIRSGINMFSPKFVQSLSLIPGIPIETLHHLRDKVDKTHPDNVMFDTYRKLCRGEISRSEEVKSSLRCMFLLHDVTSHLQRVKIEYLSYDPLVIILHDVIFNNEIENIKDIATPKLKPVEVHQFSNLEDMKVSRVRTGKSSSVNRDSNSIVKNLYRRIEDYTGLSTFNAEPLQVLYYELGDHYEVHTDFFNLKTKKKKKIVPNDRVSTLLFYLSDVDAGGYTVFPQLQLAVKPEKGSALFWFNLLRNGEGDFRTMHAACPVLSYSKWIANLWFSDKDQIFHRPCSLERNE